MKHINELSNVAHYTGMIRETLELVRLKQQGRIIREVIDKQTEIRLLEIKSRIKEFEDTLRINHEEFVIFQKNTHLHIAELIKQREFDLAIIMHERLASRFSGDFFNSICEKYNSNVGTDYIKLLSGSVTAP